MGFTCWAWVVLGLMYSTPHKSCLSIWPTENCWCSTNSSAGHLHTKETNSFILNFPKKCPADNCRNDDSGCCVNREKLILICTNYDYLTSFYTTWSQAKKNEKASLFFPNVDLPGNCTLYHDDKKRGPVILIFHTKWGSWRRSWKSKDLFHSQSKRHETQKENKQREIDFSHFLCFSSLVCVSWVEYDASWNQIALRKMVQPPNPSVVVSKSQWKDKLLLWGNQPKVFPI